MNQHQSCTKIEYASQNQSQNYTQDIISKKHNKNKENENSVPQSQPVQSNPQLEQKIKYLCGKKISEQNELFYLAKYYTDNEQWITNQANNVTFQKLVTKYERYQSRILFNQYLQDHQKNSRSEQNNRSIVGSQKQTNPPENVKNKANDELKFDAENLNKEQKQCQQNEVQVQSDNHDQNQEFDRQEQLAQNQSEIDSSNQNNQEENKLEQLGISYQNSNQQQNNEEIQIEEESQFKKQFDKFLLDPRAQNYIQKAFEQHLQEYIQKMVHQEDKEIQVGTQFSSYLTHQKQKQIMKQHQLLSQNDDTQNENRILFKNKKKNVLSEQEQQEYQQQFAHEEENFKQAKKTKKKQLKGVQHIETQIQMTQCQQNSEDDEEQFEIQPEKIPKQNYTLREKEEEVEEEEEEEEEESEVQITKIVKQFDNKKKKLKKRMVEIIDSELEEEDDSSYEKIMKKSGVNYIVRTNDQEMKKYGTFNKDVPSYISNHRIDKSILKKLRVYENYENEKRKIKYYIYKVEWKKRPSGLVPKASYYTYNELKRYIPRQKFFFTSNTFENSMNNLLQVI